MRTYEEAIKDLSESFAFLRDNREFRDSWNDGQLNGQTYMLAFIFGKDYKEVADDVKEAAGGEKR